MATIDPCLTRAIDRLHQSSSNLQAFIIIDKQSMAGCGAGGVRDLVNRLIEDVGFQSSLKPSRIVIFEHLYSFALEAPAKFLEQLLLRPEIGLATLNEE